MPQKLETGGIAIKYNDDGEPQGTAGSPILKIILEQGLSNVLVVVTRYFGGILLGTGGLVRAYSDVTIRALDDNYEQLRYYATKSNLKIINTEYLENIELIVEITKEKLDELTNSNSKKTFKFLKCDILKEKYIEIQIVSS